MNVKIALEFSSAAEATAALVRLNMLIPHEDRPDVGAPPPPAIVPAAPEPDPVINPFAGNSPDPLVQSAPAVTPPSAATGQTVAPSGVELDASGLPWDNRIHALGAGGTHPKKANGCWAAKRGLNDPAKTAAIEAELRAALSAPAASVLVPPPPPAGTVAAAPAASPPVLTPPGPTPPVLTPPAAPAPEAAPTFASLMLKITSAMQSTPPKLTQEQLNYGLQQLGLQAPMQLAQRADLVGSMSQYVDACAAQVA